MLESFLYSLNIIAPIFIIVFLGVLMKKKKFINAEFVAVCDKLVFKLALPALLLQRDLAQEHNRKAEGIDQRLMDEP